MKAFFVANERFDRRSANWEGYNEWAKLPQLVEVVSLDAMLCRRVVDFGDCDADWDHATQIGERWEFNDLEYLLGRIYSAAPRNVLAVFRNPDARVEFEHEGRRFEFVRCDLVEDYTMISR